MTSEISNLKSPMKTLILTCTRRSAFVSGYVDGLLACMASEHFAGWAHLDHESDIARGRGKLLTEVLANSRADAFLWIDDDIVFTRDDFDTIVRAPVDIIGGHYVLRHDSQTPCYGTLDVPLHTDPRIVAVDVIGTGFLRMTRRALEDMRPGMPVCDSFTHWFPAGIYDGKYQSEDYAFCQHAWAAGIPVYVHHGVRLGHVGSQTFRPQ